ncbi:hypothetical protein JCM16303_004010 [Sporobolomyces ruberrimus]
MEEAERENRYRQQQWLDGTRGNEPPLDQQLRPDPALFPTPAPSFVPPLGPPWPPPNHRMQPPPPPSQLPPNPPQQYQPHFRRRPPPHPDDFSFHHPSYYDYPYQSSPEISPMTDTSYPLYPTPSYSNPSPSTSTPSPFTTPGGTVLPLPLAPHVPYPQQYVEMSHGGTFDAVESARWMATIEGPGEESIHPQHLSQRPYRAPVPTSPQRGLAYPGLPPPIPPPIPEVVVGDQDRRLSDSNSSASIPSPNSPFVFTRSEGAPAEELNPNALIKPFIEKLYGILSRPDTYGDCMKWSASGDAFFVAHSDKLVREVLPEQFCHSNIHSFTRQLNVYNFTRMTIKQLREGLSIPSATTSEYSGWSHPLFKRGDTSKLATLNPRPSRARLLKKLEKQYGVNPGVASSVMSSTGGSSSSGGGGSRDGPRRGDVGGTRPRSNSEKRTSITSIDEYG